MLREFGAVLIGGQSVAILQRRYSARVPELSKLAAITSADVDFLGDVKQAKMLASRLKDSNVFIPRPFEDVTPNTAIVSGNLGRSTISIDFMSQIIWVNEQLLQDRYLTLSGQAADGTEIEILCLHPIDCLMNRLGNINVLHRSDQLAISSARAAVMIVEGFIDELLELGDRKDAQNALHDLEFIVRDKCAGHASYIEHRIDPTYILKRFAKDERIDPRYRALTLEKAIARTKDYLKQPGQS